MDTGRENIRMRSWVGGKSSPATIPPEPDNQQLVPTPSTRGS